MLGYQEERLNNYQFGLANRDFILHEKELKGLKKLSAVQGYNEATKSIRSQTVSKLTRKGKANIRGFIQIDVPTLQKKGILLDVRLDEVKKLMPNSHLIMIESHDEQTIELKLVYREMKFQLCGPSKVAQEHILLSFEITLKKIKETRKKISENKATENKDEKQEDDDDELNSDKILVFEENDSLVFHPEKFLKLITQMDKQKAAYRE